MWNGHIRTFIEEVDKVFLIKKGIIFAGLKKWGYFHSILFQGFTVIFIFGVMLPFLFVHYKLDWIVILLLFYCIKNRDYDLKIPFWKNSI
ncbi:ABC transporter permease [Niallia sp. Krafla_26]|uniref:ABC transporter permease n=1 Tax=Niallia sp. Krafla_26 TaxID=3064703 RepID=UPI003D162AEE